MRVTALLFAQYRARAGAGSLAVELPEGATVRGAADVVAKRTGLVLTGAMCAINERYGRPDDVLREGDRVAFLPPVSGG